MKNLSPIVRLPLMAAPLAALVCGLYPVVLYAAGENAFGQYKAMDTAIYGLFFMALMYLFREKFNEGRMDGQQGLGLGLLFNALTSLLYGLVLSAWMAAVPGVLERYRDALIHLYSDQRDALVAAGHVKAEDIDQYIHTAGQVSVGSVVLDQALWLLFKGFFLTFIFMLFFKNQVRQTPKKGE